MITVPRIVKTVRTPLSHDSVAAGYGLPFTVTFHEEKFAASTTSGSVMGTA